MMILGQHPIFTLILKSGPNRDNLSVKFGTYSYSPHLMTLKLSNPVHEVPGAFRAGQRLPAKPQPSTQTGARGHTTRRSCFASQHPQSPSYKK